MRRRARALARSVRATRDDAFAIGGSVGVGVGVLGSATARMRVPRAAARAFGVSRESRPVETRRVEMERRTIDQDPAQIRESARVRRALVQVVHEELNHKFDRTGVNVMDARVSKDFKTVHVLYGSSRFGEEHVAGRALERNAQKIRTMLSKMLSMKHTPRLVFRFEGARTAAQRALDEALVRAARERDEEEARARVRSLRGEDEDEDEGEDEEDWDVDVEDEDEDDEDEDEDDEDDDEDDEDDDSSSSSSSSSSS